MSFKFGVLNPPKGIIDILKIDFQMALNLDHYNFVVFYTGC